MEIKSITKCSPLLGSKFITRLIKRKQINFKVAKLSKYQHEFYNLPLKNISELFKDTEETLSIYYLKKINGMHIPIKTEELRHVSEEEREKIRYLKKIEADIEMLKRDLESMRNSNNSLCSCEHSIGLNQHRENKQMLKALSLEIMQLSSSM